MRGEEDPSVWLCGQVTGGSGGGRAERGGGKGLMWGFLGIWGVQWRLYGNWVKEGCVSGRGLLLYSIWDISGVRISEGVRKGEVTRRGDD